MTSTALLAPQVRPVRLRVSVPHRALVGLAALALATSGVTALPSLLSNHLGGSPPASQAATLAQPIGAAGIPLAALKAVSSLDRHQGGMRITSTSITNPAQQLTATFGWGGATVGSGDAQFSLGLTALGRAPQVQSIAPVQPQLGNGIVRYVYPAAVTERWRDASLGLEQSFVLSQRPAGTGPLTVAMAAPAGSHLVRGAVLLPGGLRYAGLRVTDARGHVLRSWLALAHGQLQIKVSDRGARYPVHIDPLVQQANLTAKDGVVGDYLGFSVAISGNTLVAGAPYHKVGINSNQGALYVFSEHAGHWKRSAELTVKGGIPNQYLGSAVAISGKTIIASAPEGNTLNEGALYVFSDASGHWKQVATLTAKGATADAELGQYSVAIHGSTIVAGAPQQTVGSVSGQGAAYVFDEPKGGWATRTQSAELTEAHGAPDDYVGWSVAISGNTILAGAPAPFQENNHYAALFVFTKRSGHWKQTAEVHHRHDVLGVVDDFGDSVAISSHTIAAGAPGTNNLYVFQSAHGKWKQAAALDYTQCDPVGCLDSNDLGSSVAFDGGAILASALDETPKGDFEVATPQYRKVSGKWREVSRLLAGAGQHSTQNELTESLASSGSTVVAGVFDGVDTGSVVVFKGRVTSEGPLIGDVTSSAAGQAQIPVTCELPSKHSTCVVKISAHRTGRKQSMGHAKPKSIPGTDIRSVIFHFNKAFEHLLDRPQGVKVTFKVREYAHGKLKAAGSTTITFTAE
jgi:hypothetical protein